MLSTVGNQEQIEVGKQERGKNLYLLRKEKEVQITDPYLKR